MNIRKALIRQISKNEKLYILTKQVRLKTLMIFGKLIPDKIYIKLQYRLRLGRKLNLNNPVLFNEKFNMQSCIIEIPCLNYLLINMK